MVKLESLSLFYIKKPLASVSLVEELGIVKQVVLLLVVNGRGGNTLSGLADPVSSGPE